MKRTAQIEMMGLVIIVVLVTIGLFFYLALRTGDTSDGDDLRERFSMETMMQNYVVTLAETHIQCATGPVNVRDLAKDCVRDDIGRYPVHGCGNDPCGTLEEVASKIVEETLDEPGYVYNLTFTYENSGGEQHLLMNVSEGTACNDLSLQQSPGVQPIPLYLIDNGGKARLMLRICD